MRDQPGWVTFTFDGRYALPSTGEVIDVASKRITTTLADETAQAVQSEKLLDLVFSGTRATKTGDQFGLGRRWRGSSRG